jgi:hypothetical protein
MTKNIISSDPSADNLRQVLEALRGQAGTDSSGKKFIIGVNLSRIIERLDKLDGGDKNED